MKNFLHKTQHSITYVIVLLISLNINAQIGDIIWEDNFDTLNTSIWNPNIGNGCEIGLCGWGNAELEYYRQENLSIEAIPGEPGNNAFVMEAKREDFDLFNFTSGKVDTENNLSVQYGLIEIRMQVPSVETGLWPAAWLLGTANVTWPAKGEIDMMEMGHRDEEITNQGHEGTAQDNYVGANAIFATEEGGVGSIAYDVNYNKPYVSTTSMANRYVTYRLYWEPTEMRFTVIDNGTEYDLYEGPLPLDPDSVTGVFNKPFYFLLDLAVGGNFTDAATSDQVTAPLPSKLYVDYIRVYEWNGYGSVDFDYGELVTETGPFGVYTENTPTNNELSFGLDAEIYVWGGTMQDGTTEAYEGNEVIAWETLNANAWFGGGISSLFGRDMSGYVEEGTLKFNIKIPADVTFRIGVTDNFTNENWIVFNANETQYGLTRNGEWGQVEIPLIDFAGTLAFQDINYMFAISSLDGDFPTSTFQLGLDNIVWDDGNGLTTSIAVTGISTTPASVALEIGETQEITSTISPSNATNANVTWTSSNTSVASINSNGMVTANASGIATITVTTKDGSYTGTSIITVVSETVEGGNLALNGTASQSSTGFNGIASRAIDGNTSGIWRDGSITHTNNEANAWWQVDLGSADNIGEINIFNRTNCCSDRLDNFTVSVINDNGATTFSQSFTTEPDPSISINANGALGSIIRVQLDDSNYLSLAEVEVYAYDGEIPTATNLFIEAEDFTNMSGIQVETTIDINGGENVGYIDTGDWIEYAIDIPTTGTYTVNSRLASDPGNAALQFQVNSVVLGTTNIDATGGWQSWTTLTTTINLSAGTQTLRLLATSGGFNINWLEIENQSTANKNTESISDSTSEITLYPVPVQDYLDVEILDFENYSHIQIIDMNGSILTDSIIESTVTTVAVDHLNNGFYLALLYQNEIVVQTLKFIK